MIRVLIIEDDPMVARINKNYIESVDGFKILGICGNEVEALEFIKKREVDLIILDIYLPKGDGISILKEIRKIRTNCDVIMVTASTELDNIKDSLRLGVIDYLIKPFEFARLKKALENYLARCSILNGSRTIKQEDIDMFTSSNISLIDETIQKGLNRLTLNRIMRFIEKNAEKQLSVEEISEGLDITKVTVRRYMDYLEKIGYIVREIEYGSVGRPAYKYKIVKF